MSADGGRRGSGAARGGGSVRAPVVSNEKRVNNCVDWSGPRAGGGFARDRPGSRAYQSLHKHRNTTACTRWAAPRTGRTSTEAPAYPAGWRARTSPGDVATPRPTARKTPRANLSPSTESRGAVSDVVRSRLSPFFTLRARRRWRRAQLTATPPPVFAENACDWTAGRRLDNSTYKKICATSPRPTIPSLPSVDGSGDEILRHGTRGGLTLEHLHRALHRRDPLVVRREFGPAVKRKRLREERHLMEHSP